VPASVGAGLVCFRFLVLARACVSVFVIAFTSVCPEVIWFHAGGIVSSLAFLLVVVPRWVRINVPAGFAPRVEASKIFHAVGACSRGWAFAEVTAPVLFNMVAGSTFSIALPASFATGYVCMVRGIADVVACDNPAFNVLGENLVNFGIARVHKETPFLECS
jgi:hypothetical protein